MKKAFWSIQPVSFMPIRWINKRNLNQYLRSHTWFLDETVFLQGKRMISVGCGEGFFLNYFKKHYDLTELVGLDLDSKMCLRARKLNPRVQIIKADATNIPFTDNSFDFVFVNALFHHVENPYQIINELIRISKSDGLITVVEPRRFHPAIFLLSLLKSRERGQLKLNLEKLQQFLGQKKEIKQVQTFPVNSFIYPYQRFPPLFLLKIIAKLEEFLNRPWLSTHLAIMAQIQK